MNANINNTETVRLKRVNPIMPNLAYPYEGKIAQVMRIRKDPLARYERDLLDVKLDDGCIICVLRFETEQV
jgi:hypothetical protein